MRSQEAVNPAVGTSEALPVGIFNGTDVLSNPDGILGLYDGSIDCCRDSPFERTLGMNEGLSLSPSADGAKEGRVVPVITDGLREADGMNEGLSLSPSADGAKEGRVVPVITDGLKEADGESDGLWLSPSADGANEADGINEGLSLSPSVVGTKEGRVVPVTTDGL